MLDTTWKVSMVISKSTVLLEDLASPCRLHYSANQSDYLRMT